MIRWMSHRRWPARRTQAGLSQRKHHPHNHELPLSGPRIWETESSCQESHRTRRAWGFLMANRGLCK